MATAWKALENSSPAIDAYDETLSESLRRTGCDAAGAPYVVRGLLRNLDRRFVSNSPQPSAIAAVFLDETRCEGASGLSEEDKVKLREIRDRRPPALPAAAQ
jgi:hypothetical protein